MVSTAGSKLTIPGSNGINILCTLLYLMKYSSIGHNLSCFYNSLRPKVGRSVDIAWHVGLRNKIFNSEFNNKRFFVAVVFFTTSLNFNFYRVCCSRLFNVNNVFSPYNIDIVTHGNLNKTK